MKKYSLIGILALLFVLVSCEKEETRAYINSESVGASIVSPQVNESLVLKLADSAKYVTFNWDAAEYGFQAAPTYLLEVDKAGGDFSEALTVLTTNSTMDSIMLYNLNVLLFDNGYEGEVAVDVDLRVRAILKGIENSAFADTVYSELQRIKVTPFTIVAVGPPPSLYMIGAAVGGWDPLKAVEVAPTDVKKQYSTKAYFKKTTDGKNFRFYTAPNWASSLGGYDVFPNYPTDLLAASGDGDKNFNFIGTDGWYEITADQNSGTITMTAVSEPLLYLTGDATHGWNFGTSAKPLKWVGHQIWEGDVDFTKDKYFRLFEQADWGPVNYGHDKITDYDTDVIIIAVGHSDPNWQFIANTGAYHVKVDKRNGSIVITPVVL
jgi:hypothetical protein